MRAEGTPADRGGGGGSSDDDDDEALLAALAHQADAFGTPISLGPSQQLQPSQPGGAFPEQGGSQPPGSPSASQQVRCNASRNGISFNARGAQTGSLQGCAVYLCTNLVGPHLGLTCSLRLTLATRSTLAAPQEAAIARAQSAQLRLLEATQRECEDILACSQMSGDGEGRDQGEEADSRRQGEPLLPQQGQQRGSTAGLAAAAAPAGSAQEAAAGDIEDLARQPVQQVQQVPGQGMPGKPGQAQQHAGHEEHEEDALFLQAMEDFEQRQQRQHQREQQRQQQPAAPSIPQTDGQWDPPCAGTIVQEGTPGRRWRQRLPQVDGSGDVIESDSSGEEASQVGSRPPAA